MLAGACLDSPHGNPIDNVYLYELHFKTRTKIIPSWGLGVSLGVLSYRSIAANIAWVDQALARRSTAGATSNRRPTNEVGDGKARRGMRPQLVTERPRSAHVTIVVLVKCADQLGLRALDRHERYDVPVPWE